MTTLYLHDNDVTSTKHGSKGSTHAGTLQVDYEYQLIEWLQDIGIDYPHIVRIESNDGREWVRQGNRFLPK